MAERMRADQALVARGLTTSREKARALIMAGQVYAGEQKVDKASWPVADADVLTVREIFPYVSRGAKKLLRGLETFGVDVQGRVCADLGASTGGFTDVLLHHGASHVYAVDVGYGQLDWKLREDPRVTVMERTNARYLTADDFPQRPTLGVMDVSFISIRKILPVICPILGETGEFVTLIKPQFEAGRERVGKKGVVREAKTHEEVLKEIDEFVAGTLHWAFTGLTYSPIKGPEGNIEFLAHLIPAPAGEHIGGDMISTVVSEAHAALDDRGTA